MDGISQVLVYLVLLKVTDMLCKRENVTRTVLARCIPVHSSLLGSEINRTHHHPNKVFTTLAVIFSFLFLRKKKVFKLYKVHIAFFSLFNRIYILHLIV